MLPIPWLLFWLGNLQGWGKRGSAYQCLCCGGGVTPPARGCLMGTSGWTFWGRHHCLPGAVKWPQRRGAHSDVVPTGPPHWHRALAADPTLLLPR